MPLGEIIAPPRKPRFVTIAAPEPPTEAETSRYVELLQLQRPTDRQERELKELAPRFSPDLVPRVEFHKVVMAEADRLEKNLRNGQALEEVEKAREAACKVEAAKRQEMLDTICRLQTRLLDGQFPEHQEAVQCQRNVERIRGDQLYLQETYQFFPSLFGLPIPPYHNNFLSLPACLQAEAMRLGIDLSQTE